MFQKKNKNPEKNEPSSVAKRETLLLIILLTGIPRHPKNVTFLRDDHIKLLYSQQQKHFREEKKQPRNAIKNIQNP